MSNIELIIIFCVMFYMLFTYTKPTSILKAQSPLSFLVILVSPFITYFVLRFILVDIFSSFNLGHYSNLILSPLIIASIIIIISSFAIPYALLRFETRDLKLAPISQAMEMDELKLVSSIRQVKNGRILNDQAMAGVPFHNVIIFPSILIDKMAPSSLLAIYHHEYGHLKHRHLIYFYIIQLSYLVFFSVILFSVFSDSLKLNLLYVSILTLFFSPLYMLITSYFSKRFENQADLFSAKIVGKEVYKNALIELNGLSKGAMERQTLTHPTLKQRIEHLDKVM